MRNLRTSITRATAGLAFAGLTAGLALTGPAASAATAPAKSSTTWLTNQLTAGLVESEYFDDWSGSWEQYTDFGLTLDFFYAFDQVNVRAGQRSKILEAIEPRAAEYTDAFGTTYAGAMGKLLTAVQEQGIDPGTYATGDLLPRLENLVQTGGDEEGRAKDVTAGKDSSNTFGQSYVVTALTTAGSDKADEAISFLLQQQCAAGFFREAMGTSSFTCDAGTVEESRPDVDATATAVLALNQVHADAPASVQDRARTAMLKASRWLATQQVRSGTFTGARNTNSTGLAAVALAETGRAKAANKAARWVNKFRVTSRMARRTALRPRDIGAIAFDVKALNGAKKRGITRGDRYVWRRATAQAAPALDLL